MGHQGDSDVEHDAGAMGLAKNLVSCAGWMRHRLSELTSDARTLGRQRMSHEPHQALQTSSGVVPATTDPYRMGSNAVPNDAKWGPENRRNPDECRAALEVARRIDYRHWAIVAEILRNQPAKEHHAERKRVLEAAEALGIEFWEESRPSGIPRRHFRLPKQ
jgi:hypothetical protein